LAQARPAVERRLDLRPFADYLEAMVSDDLDVPGAAPGKPLTPQARRALLEAAERKAAAHQAAAQKPTELGGPPGPEPTRYGDWERKGIAVDF
jgi:hypothetical protein